MHVLTTPTVALLVLDAVDPSLRSELAEVIRDDDPVGALVDALSRRGVRTAPSFACVVREDGMTRVLVRGSARVLTISGELVLEAAGVTTWAEHVVPSGGDLVLADADESVRILSLVPRRPDDASLPTAPEPQLRQAVPPTPVEAPTQETLAPPDPASPQPAPPPFEPELQAPAPASAGDEADLDFGHLLDETRFHGAEAAAVRSAGDASEQPEPARQPPSVVIPQTPAPPVVVPAAAMPVQAPTPSPPPPAGGLITGVPGSAPSSPAPPSPPPASSRSAAGEPLSASQAGDHDGDTISAPELAALRERMLGGGPPVQAVRCRGGHLNPPHADVCRSCEAPIDDRSVQIVPRPALGTLVFPDGRKEQLDAGILLGRKPDATGIAGVRAVPLADPGKGLSRTHAEIRLEGWQVLVVDRDSTNKTWVQLPGEQRRQLRPFEPCLVVPGTTVALGDVATFVYEVAT